MGSTPFLFVFAFLALLLNMQMPDSPNTETKIFAVAMPAVLFLLPALVLFWISTKKLKKLNERYSYYQNIILVQGETSIRVVAQLTNQRVAVVKNDLLRMMFMGLLEKGFIDEISNQLIFYHRSNSNGSNHTNQITVNMTMTAAAAEDNEGYEVKPKKVKGVQLAPRKVECSGCGSSSKLQPGETIDCPYCGTSIVYS